MNRFLKLFVVDLITTFGRRTGRQPRRIWIISPRGKIFQVVLVESEDEEE